MVHQLSAWLNQQIPTVTSKIWAFIQRSVGGFLGVFGFIFSMVVVPLYLYYFLIESPNIARGWADYLPLRASHFKDEVVASLTEINHYLIAFFRGQLVVSLINGVATGLGLLIVGLDFGLVIGLMLCVLGIIPYLGIMLCWIPAVIIAIVQGGSYLIPDGTWWIFPLVVTGIFVLIQQIDALIALCRAVLARHPIPSRNVVAHSDIAPARKQDPGERFPWARLAAAGIGLWPGEAPAAVDEVPPIAAGEAGDGVRALRATLRRIGYQVAPDGPADAALATVLAAFQRHIHRHAHRAQGVSRRNPSIRRVSLFAMELMKSLVKRSHGRYCTLPCGWRSRKARARPCVRCVLPKPEAPWMNSGVVAPTGSSTMRTTAS